MDDRTADNCFTFIVFSLILAIVAVVAFGISSNEKFEKSRRWDVTVVTTSGTTTYKQVSNLNVLRFDTSFVTSNGENVVIKPISVVSKETTGFVEK